MTSILLNAVIPLANSARPACLRDPAPQQFASDDLGRRVNDVVRDDDQPAADRFDCRTLLVEIACLVAVEVVGAFCVHRWPDNGNYIHAVLMVGQDHVVNKLEGGDHFHPLGFAEYWASKP